MIEAVIFDMDGLLIDSEPLWRKSQWQVFPSLGVPLKQEMFESFMGRKLDDIVESVYSQYPWKHKTTKQVSNEIVDVVISLINTEGKALVGVKECLEFCRKKKLKIALASSSDFKIIYAVLDKLGIKSYFEIIHSAEIEEYGKPHPQIFINTAKQLKVRPENCLVFEDSFHGLVAALAAKMKCIAVPDLNANNLEKFIIADKVLKNLKEFDDSSLKGFKFL